MSKAQTWANSTGRTDKDVPSYSSSGVCVHYTIPRRRARAQPCQTPRHRPTRMASMAELERKSRYGCIYNGSAQRRAAIGQHIERELAVPDTAVWKNSTVTHGRERETSQNKERAQPCSTPRYSTTQALTMDERRYLVKIDSGHHSARHRGIVRLNY